MCTARIVTGQDTHLTCAEAVARLTDSFPQWLRVISVLHPPRFFPVLYRIIILFAGTWLYVWVMCFGVLLHTSVLPVENSVGNFFHVVDHFFCFNLLEPFPCTVLIVCCTLLLISVWMSSLNNNSATNLNVQILLQVIFNTKHFSGVDSKYIGYYIH
jgi:hypothetical protein